MLALKLCWMVLMMGIVMTTLASEATIRVKVREQGMPISPVLWGVFFEEINHAGDGGLYAELVRNRSFEDGETPEAWALLPSGRKSQIAIDTHRPLHPNHPRSLRWEIGTGEGTAQLANDGYWGIAVRRGKSYRLTLYARCEPSFRGALTVSLQSQSGKVYAQKTLRGLGEAWKEFQTLLRSQATDPQARLVLSVDAPGVLWLDGVSLMPVDTFKRRPNGLRADLAQMLANLRPSFVRFPGGCFVEGNTVANALRWRNTVGDWVERPTRWCLWGYNSTQGLGLLEYLQMSEDLGAEPMLVVNCGMACQYRTAEAVPLEQLDEWIEDALFAIEYAIGAPTTPAGALRAKHGRPEPFKLRFVEVGNENWGPNYEERYARFYDAIKARYPHIQIISNTLVRSRPSDILDEHYYASPEWFLSQANRYDAYPRPTPKIFVGEYAVTQGAGTGNLRAAIAESAFMIGIERNSDIVVMAAYAPLFVNVNDRTWNPDLIGFDSARCYGTPSYYVQKLFSHYRGTHSLPTTVEAPPMLGGVPQGAIGVGTWQTQAEFRSLTVSQNGTLLYRADFQQGWKPLRGEWQVVDGVYRQTSDATDVRSIAGDPTWQNYTLSLQARKLGGREGFLILFRVRDAQNWYWWNLGGWNNTKHAVERSLGGGKTIVSDEVPGSIESGRWYDIRIEVQGSRIRCYLDGTLVHDFEEKPLPTLYANASRDERTGELILKVTNASDQPISTEILLEGLEPHQRLSAKFITLTGDHPDAENSLENPKRVFPKADRSRTVAPRFRHTFPPYSFTVVLLKG